MRSRLNSHIALAIVVVVITLLALNALFAYRSTRSLIAAEDEVQRAQSILTDLNGLLAAVTNASAAQRGYVITGDEAFTDPIDAAVADARRRLDRLEQTAIDPEVAGVLPRVRTSTEAAMEDVAAGLAARRDGVDAGEVDRLLRASKRDLDDVRSAVRRLAERQTTVLDRREGSSEDQRLLTLNATLVASAVAALTVLLAYALMLRNEHRRRAFASEEDKLARYNRLLIESTGEGMYGIDREGRCTFLNGAGARMLGLDPDEVIGQNMHELCHHHHADGSPYPVEDCPILQSFTVGKGCEVSDEVFFRKDGTSFPVDYSAFPIKEGFRKTGAVVTFSDATQRRTNEQALRESVDRFGAMADNISQLAWMADPDGNIRWYNKRWFDYTGTTPEEMEGWGWQKVHHPDHLADVTEKISRHFKSGEPWEDSFPLRAAGGEYRWFLSRMQPIRNEAGEVIRWFGTNTDITEARETQEALQENEKHLEAAKDHAEEAKAQAEAYAREAEQARSDAEQANVSKSQFLANMSHELRTPLNAVIMYSELLQEEAEDEGVESFIPDLDKIRNAGKHLLALVNGVLDLSKIEAGKMELYLETFDVAEMARDVATTVQPLIEKNKNTLDLQVAGDVGPMHADLTKVRQVLFNLLSNASKFTEDGTIALAVTRRNGDVELIVSDSGIGMTEEQTAKLFQPFTQADASTTRKYGGTGLGLVISKRFCEMMGGRIRVDSTPGQGTTFTVVLPANVAQPKAAEAAPHPADGDHGVVLVIDDDPGVREIISRTLTEDGAKVVRAADGVEGLRLATQLQPTLIFLDVMMPKMDGWAVLTQLKNDEQLRDIPVVMMTMVNETEMGYMLGASEYLNKPVDRDRLANVLAKYRKHEEGGDGPEQVLIVEDDEATREVLRRSLVKQGWHVAEATNGLDALERMRARVPALILLDLQMPEMDGFEFLEVLRTDPHWATVPPVVVLTSKDLTPEERATLTGQVERVVQKGTYSREALLREVRKIAADHVRHDPAASGEPAGPLPEPGVTAEPDHEDKEADVAGILTVIPPADQRN